ncbi:hemerythrin HHE cation binding domain-containing protein [Kribbella antiqua]|uniref:Hemerythrin HHE cation binding domain-containing protein n=1 Tax=Kribbella antiqua TaxID=2512217 RepID=A0A4R2IIJ2_9ACTN|nr:hemerythrin domain-containing protein [Kribbella antiqua]TCO44367.1 hemerythrin HHE cation binding domain-containing protein [Kribbella antiqua]
MNTELMLPGQAAAPPGPVDLTSMYVMHHAFRRDLAAFKAAVVGTPLEDRTTWKALAARWGKFVEILHKHHTGEDDALWPLLMSRADAADRETLEAMEGEHAEIDPLLSACTAGFDRLASYADADARDALEVRVVALGEHLARHLAHEECDALALVQRYLVNDDWLRLEKETFQPAYGPRDIPFVASWALHELPAEQFRHVRDSMAGRPMELVWRLFWRRPFERRERRAFRYV